MQKSILVLLVLIGLNASAQQKHPSFMEQGNIYEVNIRQYTPQGTFNAFAKHIPRLKQMGVQTLWLMPLQPISVEGRKGSLGSYYAVSNFTSVNPEFGTITDFNNMVSQAHALGMKVIIDWVPNHTGADHEWLTTHPDFYERDSSGKAIYTADWSDTRELNFANETMQDSMVSAMKYWVLNTKIDGFRVDVAWGVPYAFWNKCIPALKKERDLFFLAEADDNELHKTGFDATYTWTEFHIMNDIAAGKKDVSALDSAFTKIDTSFMKGAWRLYFTSNHDENSWNKADYATMPGAVHAPFAVLTLTYNRTMPLIYSGQEEPLLRPLAFFEKDSINFNNYKRAPFYKTLLHLRKTNAAFKESASFTRLNVNNPKQVIAYERKKGDAAVIVVLNLSNKPLNVELPKSVNGKYYTNVFTKQVSNNISSLQLPAWGYKVFEISNK